MAKTSFTIFETLLSIVLLLIIIVGFNKYTYYDNFDKEFILLNKIENSFNIKSYDNNFSRYSSNIKVIKNDVQEEIITINVRKYEDEKIKLIKYEL